MISGTHRLGVDIGGTFTDIVIMDGSGAVYSKKLLSTPGDYSEAIENGVSELLGELDVNADQISEFVHATTVATNAIIERKGVKVALVTTQGFRDVLELSRFRAPRPYDMGFRKPEPLVTRELRFEAIERMGALGDVVVALDERSIREIAQALRMQRVDAVAVCFLNSHANDIHEKRAAELLRSLLPGVPITASTSLLPQIGEYERTSTTVVNAYIRPVIQRYVQALERRLGTLEIKAPLMIMQSSGGISPGSLVAEKPIYIIESGPAAGVLGGQRLGVHIGVQDMIVFDMGGTTAKATIIERSRFGVCPETEVGGGAALGQRIIKGSGYPVQVPTIDIAEVGAGGGSIATVDTAGGLKVGPSSAGAAPGPVCYDRGGKEPTVTDANLLLGYLNPEALVGGELTLNFSKARSAVAALGRGVKLEETDTAYGIHLIANATMLRALRGVSSERGQDPSRFSMLAIGGNGPVHAATLAEAAGMRHIIVPPVAGLFSALGMLFADVEHQLAASFYRKLAQVAPQDINAAATDLIESGRKLLASEGYSLATQQRIVVCAELKYVGQTAPLTVPLPELPVTAESVDRLVRAFEEEHLKTFGYVSSGEPLQFVALGAVCQGVPETPRMPSNMRRGNERMVARAERRAYFGEEHGWRVTPVIARGDLTADAASGPLIIEEYDTTIVVRPGWSARLDTWNNVHIERVQ